MSSNPLQKSITLAIDSSTACAGVALIQNGVVLSVRESMRQKSHSEFLNQGIAQVMQEAGADFTMLKAIAITEGPGSFTGLRVAGNIAKTLGYTLQIPLIKMSSLEVLARQVQLPIDKDWKIIPMINAFKNMVFVGAYTVDKKEIVAPTLIENEKIGEFLEPYFEIAIVGDGYMSYHGLWSEVFERRIKQIESPESNFPRVTTLGLRSEELYKLGETLNWNQFLPLYLKASEAENNLRKGLLTPQRIT